MPLDNKGRPVLNKPFKGKSTPANKKYSVYVKADNKKGYKTISWAILLLPLIGMFILIGLLLISLQRL